MRNAQPEFQLQKQVTTFLRLQYPKVFFLSDAISHISLNPMQGARNKSIQCTNFACPDLFIAEPRKGFHSLFIELKADTIFKKDGFTLKSNPHVERQLETINALNQKGFRARIMWDFTEIIKEIKWYLDGEQNYEF